MRFFNQSQSEVEQNQRKPRIPAQLKTALLESKTLQNNGSVCLQLLNSFSETIIKSLWLRKARMEIDCDLKKKNELIKA